VQKSIPLGQKPGEVIKQDSLELFYEAMFQLSDARDNVAAALDAVVALHGRSYGPHGAGPAIRAITVVQAILDRLPRLLFRASWQLTHLMPDEEAQIKDIVNRWNPSRQNGRMPR